MRAFGNLPDDILLREARSSSSRVLFDRLCRRFTRLKDGVYCFQSFITECKDVQDPETIKRLKDDRIRIIKGLNGLDANPPEAILGNDGKKHSSVLNVTYFPLDDKELPDESVSNLLDHLCAELDFMNYLCRQEQSQWARNHNALDAISQETEFLRGNLNGWVGVFCKEAVKHSSTGFYKGFLSILENFISQDLEYLNNLILTTN